MNILESLIGASIVITGGRAIPIGTTGKIKQIYVKSFCNRGSLRIVFKTNNRETLETNANNVSFHNYKSTNKKG